MNWFYLVLGMLLILLSWTESIWTTLWVDGHAAPLTKAHTRLTQRLIHQSVRRAHHRFLSLTGPLVLMSAVFFWSALLWVGFVLLFAADPGSLAHSHTGSSATWSERIYFVGYSIFTLGNGDFSPQGRWWQLATVVSSMSGFFMIGLTVTYLLSVLAAAVHLRSFASQVQAVGKTAEEFVASCWDGSSFRAVDLQLLSLTEKLTTVTERLAAYPMAHYYHAQSRSHSLAVGVTVFDEALLLFSDAIQADHRPAPSILKCARDSVALFLENAQHYISTADSDPAAPTLDQLRKSGLPISSNVDLVNVSRSAAHRRRLLKGFIEMEKRDWPGSGVMR